MINNTGDTTTEFDRIYKSDPAIFGSDADPLLQRFYSLIDHRYPVVDIGCGQGRNSIFLYNLSYRVFPIDPSAVAIASFEEIPGIKNTDLQPLCTSYEKFLKNDTIYSAFLVFGLLPILTVEQIKLLVNRLRSCSQSSSIIFITAFTTSDPSYRLWKTNNASIGPNSFRNKKGNIRTFLKPGTLGTYFPDYKTIYYSEGFGPWHTHGNHPRERHFLAEAVYQKI